MHLLAEQVQAANNVPLIHSVLPTFDTTALHALAAVEFSLSQ